MNEHEFTQHLHRWRNGDQESLNQIIPSIFGQLRAIARNCFASENPGHTLQATALVNEAYLHLVNKKISWQDRAHFFAVAARQMRFILVDHAKSKHRIKRGGEVSHQSLTDTIANDSGKIEDIILIEQVLTNLEAVDERAARIFEIKFFAGLTAKEIAEVEGVSLTTVERDLRATKAFITNEINNL